MRNQSVFADFPQHRGYLLLCPYMVEEFYLLPDGTWEQRILALF